MTDMNKYLQKVPMADEGRMTGQEIIAALEAQGWQLDGDPYHAPDMGTYQNIQKDGRTLPILTGHPLRPSEPYEYRGSFVRSMERELKIELR